MKTLERYIDPRFNNFSEIADRANSLYKKSRALVGVNDVKSRFLADSSAWFGEQAFRLADNAGVESFVSRIIAKDAVVAYFEAGLYSDVMRFGNFAKDAANDPVFAKSIEPYLKASDLELPTGVSHVVTSIGIRRPLCKTLL